MSTYCALETAVSREAALDYQSRHWIDPARPRHEPEKPLEEFYGKNGVPLLWLPLFAPTDLVRIVPPPGTRLKFLPEHGPEPFPVLLSSASAALQRLRLQSNRLFSMIDLSSPHPSLDQFIQIWETRLIRRASRWMLFNPGDVFAFIEGDDLAGLLASTLDAIAGETTNASAEMALREMMGNPFANPYGETEAEIVHSWYHILAGGVDDEHSPDSWPPPPTIGDMAMARDVLLTR